jgi:hypothetical protein
MSLKTLVEIKIKALTCFGKMVLIAAQESFKGFLGGESRQEVNQRCTFVFTCKDKRIRSSSLRLLIRDWRASI